MAVSSAGRPAMGWRARPWHLCALILLAALTLGQLCSAQVMIVYVVRNNPGSTYTAAKDYCNSIVGDLATVETEVVLNKLREVGRAFAPLVVSFLKGMRYGDDCNENNSAACEWCWADDNNACDKVFYKGYGIQNGVWSVGALSPWQAGYPTQIGTKYVIFNGDTGYMGNFYTTTIRRVICRGYSSTPQPGGPIGLPTTTSTTAPPPSSTSTPVPSLSSAGLDDSVFHSDTDPGNTPRESSGLPWWGGLIIGLIFLVLIVITIVVAICCVQKRKAKKRAVVEEANVEEARNEPSDESDSDSDASSTSSNSSTDTTDSSSSSGSSGELSSPVFTNPSDAWAAAPIREPTTKLSDSHVVDGTVQKDTPPTASPTATTTPTAPRQLPMLPMSLEVRQLVMPPEAVPSYPQQGTAFYPLPPPAALQAGGRYRLPPTPTYAVRPAPQRFNPLVPPQTVASPKPLVQQPPLPANNTERVHSGASSTTTATTTASATTATTATTAGEVKSDTSTVAPMHAVDSRSSGTFRRKTPRRALVSFSLPEKTGTTPSTTTTRKEGGSDTAPEEDK